MNAVYHFFATILMLQWGLRMCQMNCIKQWMMDLGWSLESINRVSTNQRCSEGQLICYLFYYLMHFNPYLSLGYIQGYLPIITLALAVTNNQDIGNEIIETGPSIIKQSPSSEKEACVANNYAVCDDTSEQSDNNGEQADNETTAESQEVEEESGDSSVEEPADGSFMLPGILFGHAMLISVTNLLLIN